MKLNYIRQFLRPSTQEGFTLLEATIAMFLLSLAMSLNLPVAVLLQQQNVTQEAKLGASTVAKDLLGEIRKKTRNESLPPVIAEKYPDLSDADTTNDDPLSRFGFDYGSTTYICTGPSPEEVEKDDTKRIVQEIDPTIDTPPLGETEHLSKVKYMGVKNCSTDTSSNKDTSNDKKIRYIVIQINRNGQTEPIHTVETVFIPLVPEDKKPEDKKE